MAYRPVSVAGAAPPPATTTLTIPADQEDVMAQLVDEIVFAEGEQQAAEDREAAALRCLEAVARYATVLERSVVVPAVGELNSSVAAFHEAAKARDQSASSIADLFVPERVTPQSHPQLAQAYSQLSQPANSTMATLRRNDVLGKLPRSRALPEDAYVLSTLLLDLSEELQGAIRQATDRVQAIGAGGGAAEPPMLASTHRPEQRSPSRGGDTEALRKEFDLTRQNYEARLQLVQQEKQLLEVKLENAQQASSRLDHDNQTLRLQIEALGEKETLLESTASEKNTLARRVEELESTVARNAEDKLEVASRFQVLQRALQQATMAQPLPGTEATAAEMQFLRDENARLMQQLHAAQVSSSEETQLLRQQLVAAQQKLHSFDGRGAVQADAFAHDLEKLRMAGEAAPQQAAAAPGPDPVLKQKLKVLEMTVTSLNAELSAMEHKLGSLEKTAAEERSRLLNELEGERSRTRDEQAEVDGVMSRMTTELEGLMKENGLLKAKLKEYHEQLVLAIGEDAVPPTGVSLA